VMKMHKVKSYNVVTRQLLSHRCYTGMAYAQHDMLIALGA